MSLSDQIRTLSRIAQPFKPGTFTQQGTIPRQNTRGSRLDDYVRPRIGATESGLVGWGQATQCLRESVYSEYLVDARIVARKHVEIRKADTITTVSFIRTSSNTAGVGPGRSALRSTPFALRPASVSSKDTCSDGVAVEPSSRLASTTTPVPACQPCC